MGRRPLRCAFDVTVAGPPMSSQPAGFSFLVECKGSGPRSMDYGARAEGLLPSPFLFPFPKT